MGASNFVVKKIKKQPLKLKYLKLQISSLDFKKNLQLPGHLTLPSLLYMKW